MSETSLDEIYGKYLVNDDPEIGIIAVGLEMLSRLKTRKERNRVARYWRSWIDDEAKKAAQAQRDEKLGLAAGNPSHDF